MTDNQTWIRFTNSEYSYLSQKHEDFSKPRESEQIINAVLSELTFANVRLLLK